jgi:hypothetical protein
VNLFSTTLTDPFADTEALERRRYGVIEVCDGRLAAIHLRPWPKLISTLGVVWWGRLQHAHRSGNRCWLYYNQPWRYPTFLALKYVVSTRECTFATFHRSLQVLDEVARIKRTDAIVCDAWNMRISDRLLARWGWQPHLPSRWHRHYIKRLYGVYPRIAPDLCDDLYAGAC